MAENTILFRGDWELVEDTSTGEIFWRNVNNDERFKFSPNPGDDDDIARMRDIGGAGGGGGGAERLSDLDIDDTVNWQGYGIENLGPVEVESIAYREGLGPIQFPAHHTRYDDDLNNKEIARYTCRPSVVVEISRLEVNFLGGGNDPDFEIEFYDETNQQVLASTSDRLVPDDIGSSEPYIGRSSPGSTVLLRITNQTGQSQRASITGTAGRRMI